ncbi:MAG: serine/threonine protein kinase [Cellvibrionaceae bacterium]
MNDSQGTRFFPGQKIEQYILGEQIAIGGMGQVFLAFQESMNRQVAMKFLPPVDSENADTVARFEREVNMISSLEHPHIVPVYGFGDVEGIPYIVMRYMSGGTLRDSFQGGKLDLVGILAIVNQIVTALDYAHEQGIIHRDLKPSNIFLDERNNAYLADFGLAKTISGSHDLTRTDEGISGTPEYMSPEQVRGLRLDGRTDIYSLGVIVFQILSGQPPFSGSNPMETVLKQISDPIPLISLLQPTLPKELDAVFNKVLAKAIDHRYQTGREFINDLYEVLDSIESDWRPASSLDLVDVQAKNNIESTNEDSADPTKTGILNPATDLLDDATLQGISKVKRPQRILGYFTVVIFLLIGLSIAGYMLYGFLYNPFQNIEVQEVNRIESPRDIEFDAEGNVWVIGDATGEIYKLQSACSEALEGCGSTLAQVEVGSRPLFLVSGENEMLVGRQLSPGLTGISLDGNSMRPIEFPHVPADAVVFDSFIWITSGQDLIQLDTNGNEIATFSAGNTANSLYQTEDYIWVALEGEGRLRRFNLLLKAFDLDILLPVSPNQLISIIGDEANRQMWVSFNRDSQLIQIDSATGELMNSYATSGFPVDIEVYDNNVWIVAKGDNEIVAYSRLDGSIIGTIITIDSPVAIAIEPCEVVGCAHLWAVSESTGFIYRMDVSSTE